MRALYLIQKVPLMDKNKQIEDNGDLELKKTCSNLNLTKSRPSVSGIASLT